MAEGPSFEKFACAPGLKLEAHERLTDVHLDNIAARLDRLEAVLARLEKRLWLAVYGVVAVILAQAMQSILAAVPG